MYASVKLRMYFRYYIINYPYKTAKSQKSFKKLKGEDFFCEEDALKAAEKWIQEFPFIVFEKVNYHRAKDSAAS